jgi:Rrf2 family protein
MQIPAKTDYAIRALLTLAASDVSVSAEHLAQEQDLPAKFLGAILSDLRRGGLVSSQRGPEGGFKLARDADQISIADVVRVVSGPMAGVRGMRPETLEYEGDAQYLREVWIAVRGALREVLEHVTLGQTLRGELPDAVTRFTTESDSWDSYRRRLPRQSRTGWLGVGERPRQLRQRRRRAHHESAHGGDGGH